MKRIAFRTKINNLSVRFGLHTCLDKIRYPIFVNVGDGLRCVEVHASMSPSKSPQQAAVAAIHRGEGLQN